MNTSWSVAAVRAPAFPEGLRWLNVARPLALSDLRGRVVLLDFWTYCCINCLHVVPDLQKLEAQFGDKLTVIGVHSGKFDNEKNDANIRAAVVRYGIDHPVVVDNEFAVWDRFAVRSWPTFVVIDPNGYVAAQFSGEGNYAALEQAIRAAAGATSTAALAPLPRALERDKTPQGVLAYPAKIAADEKNERLFIADTEHHRVIETDPAGTIRRIIGSGSRGAADGSFAVAEFSRPHGVALRGDELFVADTGNHLIRKVALTSGEVQTIAGTGAQGYDRRGGAAARQQPLNSPWDLAVDGDSIYIAMAGSHQIWRYDGKDKTVGVFSGSGVEAIVDGPAGAAAFAQPSGLTIAGGALFVADSETSSVRSVSLKDGSVTTLIGRGLFDFGDAVGRFDSALLQHPLGIVADGTSLFVADSYNHRIKRLDLAAKTASVVAGAGTPGRSDGERDRAGFSEPGGLSLAGGRLYVADTNNSAIRVVDIKSGVVQTVAVDAPPAAPPRPAGASGFLPNLTEEARPAAVVRSLSDLTVEVKVQTPLHHEINREAPGRITIRAASLGDRLIGEASLDDVATTVPVHWGESPPEAGEVELVVEAVLYYCAEAKKAVCKIKSFRFFQPVKVDQKAASSAITLEAVS